MGPLEDFVGCTITHDLINITLKIFQMNLITKTTQGLNEDMKSLTTSNN